MSPLPSHVRIDSPAHDRWLHGWAGTREDDPAGPPHPLWQARWLDTLLASPFVTALLLVASLASVTALAA